MSDSTYVVLPIDEVPSEPGWLLRQPQPVIAVGNGTTDNADVLLAEEDDLQAVVATIEGTPQAALVLVQVLRTLAGLPVEEAITVESLAYATLQGGTEYKAWLTGRPEVPQLISGGEGEPVLLQREGDILYATLNRPRNRNSLTVEMRDALVELFELVIADDSIERVHLSGGGACFSVGGELREFGLAPDPATAHRIRSIQNPSRLLARVADRVSCHLHSACLGSGIELPAFAARVSAAPNTFFQLPELRFGLIPGAGGCVSISRRIGRQRSAWLALSGKKITARTALEWGLVDEISSA